MANENKKFNDAVKEQLDVGIAIQRDTRAEIVRLLKLAEDQIIVTLASQPTDYQTWQLPQLQRDIERILNDYNAKASGAISSAANSAWAAGQALIDLPLQAGGVYIMGQAPRIDTQMLEAMRQFMTSRIKDIGDVAINKINQELGLVIIGAAHPSDAITSVKDILGDSSRVRATTIVRTEVGGIFEIASQERKLQAAEYLPGLKKQWRRSGKVHSRLSHDAIDGQIRDVADPFIILGKTGKVKLMHPRDPHAPAAERINCGCVSLPLMLSWDVITPGRKNYTADEIAANPFKQVQEKNLAQLGDIAQLSEAFNLRQKRIPAGQKGAGRWTSTGGLTYTQKMHAPAASVRNQAKFVKRAISSEHHDVSPLGKINNHAAIKAATGLDVAGHSRIIDTSGVNHVMKSHGNHDKEQSRSPQQRAVTLGDFKHIQSIVTQPDSIQHAGKSKITNLNVIHYEKNIKGETFHYFEEIRVGRKVNALATMYVVAKKN